MLQPGTLTVHPDELDTAATALAEAQAAVADVRATLDAVVAGVSGWAVPGADTTTQGLLGRALHVAYELRGAVGATAATLHGAAARYRATDGAAG